MRGWVSRASSAAAPRRVRAASGIGPDYYEQSATTFGIGLDYHWSDYSPQGAHRKLEQGGWDTVVLQDLSFNATDNPNRTRTYVRFWDGEISQETCPAGQAGPG